MVLDEATASPTNTVRDDSSPASDNDAYGAETDYQKRIAIDYTQLPKPIPIIASLVGFSQARIERQTEAIIADLSNIVHRPLNEIERQAVAYHTAKGCSIASYGLPIGLAGGMWREIRTRQAYKFPFYTPDLGGKFDPQKLGPLRGATAQMGWHLIRRAVWYSLGGYVGKSLVGAYAAVVAAVGERSDARLKNVVEALVHRQKERRGELSQPAQGSWTQSRSSEQRQSPEEPASDSSAPGYSPGSDAATFSGEQVRRGQSSYQAAAAPERTSFGMDDASPQVGPAAENTARSSGSAWDRLRRGGPEESNAPARQSQTSESSAWANRRAGTGPRDDQSPTAADDDHRFETYNQGDRDKAKIRAQKEFDARVERERKGEDFDDSDAKWR